MVKVTNGTKGYDLLEGTARNDVISAFAGDDLIRELPIWFGGSDIFKGMAGDDKILSFGGHDLLFGGRGDDQFVILRRSDVVKVHGGEGSDELTITGLAEADAGIATTGDKTVITDADGFRLVLHDVEVFDFAM